MNFKSFFTDWKIILMIFFIISSIIILNPKISSNGVLVSSVSGQTSKYLSSGDIIIGLNGVVINSIEDYNAEVSKLSVGDKVIFEVKNKGNIYPFFVEQEDNHTNLGINVVSIPFSNIEFGIDINGGTKVMLSPESKLSYDELENVKGILEQRLNVYGFKEIPITIVSDFSGNDFIKIELPSSISVESINDLLEKQGKFEARIGNNTVFTGDDIQSICITGQNCVSKITASSGGFVFAFSMVISESAAKNFADITNQLISVGEYLNDTIGFYLDGEFLEGSALNIKSDLKGVEIREPTITGGANTIDEAKASQNKLMSMLQSNNLPVKLNIESVEVVSPKLGSEFLSNIALVFLLAILGVDIVIALRYKNIKIAIPIIIVTFSEILITLGIATLFKWTFDLSAIAGLIASVGTGVDDQIIITDEILSDEKKEKNESSVKNKVKEAFVIVIVTFATSVAVMLPLAVAGVGILKGFATTSIISILVGVLITRPAFGRIMELIFKK